MNRDFVSRGCKEYIEPNRKLKITKSLSIEQNGPVAQQGRAADFPVRDRPRLLDARAPYGDTRKGART